MTIRSIEIVETYGTKVVASDRSDRGDFRRMYARKVSRTMDEEERWNLAIGQSAGC